MRLLFLPTFYVPFVGGAEILLQQLIADFRARGHEAMVITSLPFETSAQIDEVDGVTVHRFPAHHALTENDPRLMLAIQRDVRRVARDFEPDLTHLHDVGPVQWIYLRHREQGVPLVITLHSVMSHIARGQSLKILSQVLPNADAVTGVSNAVREDTASYAPSAAHRMSVITNGIAPLIEKPTQVPDGSARFLCLGRLVFQKAYDVAIRAVARLVPDHPDVQLMIAGVGPEETMLRDLIGELGVSSQVHLLGEVDRDRVAELLEACTALVAPSKFEGMPLAVLESAFAARPVIGTAVPGLTEAVIDGETGIVVPLGDDDALARAMRRLIEDRGLATKLGAGARAWVEREHSLAACAEAYEALYERVVAGAS